MLSKELLDALIFHLGSGRHTLSLDKMIESRARDLSLSNALYFIRVIFRTDDYSARDKYDCKKCRRVAWNVRVGDTGPVVTHGRLYARE